MILRHQCREGTMEVVGIHGHVPRVTDDTTRIKGTP